MKETTLIYYHYPSNTTTSVLSAAGMVSDVLKLNTSDVALFGRQAETEILDELYSGCSESSRVLLVGAASGIGKSALIRSRQRSWTPSVAPANRDDNPTDNGCFFVQGKFEVTGNQPFSTVVNALNDVWDLILADESCTNMVEELKQSLQKHVVAGADAVLRIFMPKLFETCFQGSQQQNYPLANVICKTQVCRERLMLLMSIVLKCFSSACNGSSRRLVLWFDDLHWGDPQSLDLLKFLVIGAPPMGVLFLLSYRDSEKDHGNDFARTFVKFKQIEGVVQMQVGVLSLEALNEMMCSILKCDQTSETGAFVEEIMKKCGGNPLSVLEFLQLIHEEGLLYYAPLSFKWDWDIQKIMSETKISDSIVDLVLGNIRKLPEETQQVLKLASCIGYQFHCHFLAAFLEEQDVSCIGRHGLLDEDEMLSADKKVDFVHFVETHLEIAAHKGYVNRVDASRNRYKFAHDKIYQASNSLIPDGEFREMLQTKLGHYIIRLSTLGDGKDDSVWMEPLATYQFSLGSACMADTECRIDLARLNLKAAYIAIKTSALFPAVLFLRAGVDFLDPILDKWQSQYPLCLGLHCTLAEVERQLGNHDRCLQISAEVIQRGRSLVDKFRAYYTTIESTFLGRDDLNSSIDLAVQLLADLGHPVRRDPPMPFVVANLLKTKKALMSQTDHDILQLPEMSDESQLRVTKILDLLSFYSAIGSKVELAAMCWMKIVRLSLRHGLSKYSPFGFVGYGILLSKLGFLDEASSFGTLAEAMADRLSSEISENTIRATILANVHLTFLKCPFHDIVGPMVKAYHDGISIGEVHVAMIGALAYSLSYIHFGLPLDPIGKDLPAFAEQAGQFGLLKPQECLRIMHQYVLNLRGEGEDRLVLKGSAFDEGMIEVRKAHADFNMNNCHLFYSMQASLAYIMGDYKLAWQTTRDASSSCSTLMHKDYGLRTLAFRSYEGLTAFALARSSSFPPTVVMYRAAGHRVIKMLNKVVKGGSGTYYPMLKFLEAEDLAYRGKPEQVQKAYDEAIKTLSRSGSLHFAAMANERAGCHFLEKDEYLYLGEAYLTKSFHLYHEWGGRVKSHQMKQQYSFLETSEPITSGTSLRGRTRFDKRETEKLTTFTLEQNN
jgi:predicted ATPase